MFADTLNFCLWSNSKVERNLSCKGTIVKKRCKFSERFKIKSLNSYCCKCYNGCEGWPIFLYVKQTVWRQQI